MTDRHTVIPRTMCIVFHGDDVLLIKASDKKAYPGMYDPIGGHIENGEDIMESALREIKEESGLVVHSEKLRGVIHVTNFFGKDIMMFVVTCQSDSADFHADHDEGTLEWVPISNLQSVWIFDDVKPILETIIKMTGGQFFTGKSNFDDTGKLLDLTIRIH